MPPVHRRPTGKKSGWNLSIMIETITDSVERIGADKAFYATIILLSFGSVATARASAAEALLLAIGLVAGWLSIKWVNMLIVLQLGKNELGSIKAEEGTQLHKLREQPPEQLSLWDGDKA